MIKIILVFILANGDLFEEAEPRELRDCLRAAAETETITLHLPDGEAITSDVMQAYCTVRLDPEPQPSPTTTERKIRA